MTVCVIFLTRGLVNWLSRIAIIIGIGKLHSRLYRFSRKVLVINRWK